MLSLFFRFLSSVYSRSISYVIVIFYLHILTKNYVLNLKCTTYSYSRIYYYIKHSNVDKIIIVFYFLQEGGQDPGPPLPKNTSLYIYIYFNATKFSAV